MNAIIERLRNATGADRELDVDDLTCDCGRKPQRQWAGGGRFMCRIVCGCGRKTRMANCGHGDSSVDFWINGIWADDSLSPHDSVTALTAKEA